MTPEASAVHDGQAVYTSSTLKAYDVMVHGVSNPLVWRCPTSLLKDWYGRHLGAEHCDVGVGTGYLLDQVASPEVVRRLVLLDLNADCLAKTSERLARFSPAAVQVNVLEPVEVPMAPFDSIGLGYVLHCVPGGLDDSRSGDKRVVFDHLGRLLKEGGVMFGATVLGRPKSGHLGARALIGLYNRMGIFHNQDDSLRGLCEALALRFAEHEVHVRGEVALFRAKGYRQAA